MDRDTLRKKLCSEFCTFYRPGREEETGCLGFHVVNALLEQKRTVDFSQRSGRPRTCADTLSRNMCPRCQYYEDGCDYAATVENAMPCGGFVFLLHLLDEGVIAVDDVKNIH